MMDLAPILTGIAVAGLICQATAVPVPFKVEAILPQAEGAPYATMAAQIGKDMLASLIPYRVLKNGGVTYHLGDKSTPPLQVWAQEKLTGLTIFKVEPARIYDGQADLTPPGILKRGDKLSFASSKNETTQGIYVGMEHSIGDTSFPLRLIRAQFPKLAVPPIGQPCYDSENPGRHCSGRFPQRNLPPAARPCHLLPGNSSGSQKSAPGLPAGHQLLNPRH